MEIGDIVQTDERSYTVVDISRRCDYIVVRCHKNGERREYPVRYSHAVYLEDKQMYPLDDVIETDDGIVLEYDHDGFIDERFIELTETLLDDMSGRDFFITCFKERMDALYHDYPVWKLLRVYEKLEANTDLNQLRREDVIERIGNFLYDRHYRE